MARARRDLTGQVFGRLTVLGLAGIDDQYHAKWLCQCECGGRTEAYGSNLVRGKTRSCGCLVRAGRKPTGRTVTPWRNPKGAVKREDKLRILAALGAWRQSHGSGWAAAVSAAMGRTYALPVDRVMQLGTGFAAPKLEAAQWRALDRAMQTLTTKEDDHA